MVGHTRYVSLSVMALLHKSRPERMATASFTGPTDCRMHARAADAQLNLHAKRRGVWSLTGLQVPENVPSLPKLDVLRCQLAVCACRGHSCGQVENSMLRGHPHSQLVPSLSSLSFIRNAFAHLPSTIRSVLLPRY